MLLESILPLLGSLRGQVFLVTGASSGIGRVTAEVLGRQGASVALFARRRDELKATAALVEKRGGRALVLPGDVTNARAARNAVQSVQATWGRLDCLVNNAGILVPSTVQHLRVSDLKAMWQVNVVGALLMMQAALPVMHAQQSGTIVNIASLAGRRGVSPLGGYCASKFALVGLTEALRTEIDAAQIHVALVMPGVIETPMLHDTQALVETFWPSLLNMPAEWVAAAVLLAIRFGLREVSVPPGAGTIEVVAALAPGITDALIGWTQSAAKWLSRAQRPKAPKARSKK